MVNKNEALVRFLLENGVDPDLKNTSGETALHMAQRKGLRDLAAILIDAGACNTCPDNRGETPEDEAAKYN